LKVVCDASTLIALARIGQLEILARTGSRVVISREVYEEVVVRGVGKPGATEVREASWIETNEVTDHSMVARFRVALHAGESEAIALAKEIDADLIILDDEEARDTAQSEGLNVVGLLAFLVMAKERGTTEQVQPLLDVLKQQGFFMSDELYYHILRRAGEV
jgi:predicted nucleic acid-binding protein